MEVDFCHAYRHALTHPGDTWAVYAPTDSIEPATAELAPWSFLDCGPPPKEDSSLRENPYVGKGWYCRGVLRYMFGLGLCSPADVRFSFWPSRELPCDTFLQATERIEAAVGALVAERPGFASEIHRFG